MASLANTPKFIMIHDHKRILILAEMRDVIVLIGLSTQRLHLSLNLPKWHIVAEHLVKMIGFFKGITEYFKQWAEYAHQMHKKITVRGKLQYPVAKANYSICAEKLGQNAIVSAKIKEVNVD